MLADAIKAQYPDADFHPVTGNVALQDDGDGQYIAKWDEAVLGPQPTEEEVAEMLASYVPPPPELTVAPETTLLYEHENRLLALEGKPSMPIGDFIDKVEGIDKGEGGKP